MKKISILILMFVLCMTMCFIPGVTVFAEGSTVTVTADTLEYSDEAQTVTVTITVDPGADITAYGGNVVLPEGWSVNGSVKVKGTDKDGDPFTSKQDPAADNNYSFNQIATMTATSVAITYNVPASASGEFTLGATNLILSKDGKNQLEGDDNGITATTIVNIAKPATPTEGYIVTMSSDALSTGVAKGEPFNINLNVSNTEATTFNAFSGILTYDKSKVSYTGNGTIDEFGVENDSDAGTLKITRANQDVDISKDPELSLPFKAEAAGDAVFELTSASVKVDEAANAEGQDAPVAVVEGSPLMVKVLETYTITFAGGEGATGDAPSIGPFTAGKKFNLPGAGSLTRDGFVFSGWNDGTNNYSEGAEYTMPAENVTFTAQWTEDIIVTPVSANPTTYFGSQYKLIAATINASGYVPTYDSKEMFLVEGYDNNTYYYVIDGEYDSSKFAYKAGTAETIAKPDNDVNQTGTVDINDAQFVYNIYNGTSPTKNIVQRLLLADTNRDKTVNTQDCAVVVQAI